MILIKEVWWGFRSIFLKYIFFWRALKDLQVNQQTKACVLIWWKGFDSVVQVCVEICAQRTGFADKSIRKNKRSGLKHSTSFISEGLTVHSYKLWDAESFNRTHVHPRKKKSSVCGEENYWFPCSLNGMCSDSAAKYKWDFVCPGCRLFVSLSFVCAACILFVLICIRLAGGFSLLGSELRLRRTFTWIKTEPRSHKACRFLLFYVCKLRSPIHCTAEK